jgi:hypothetical protein
LLASAPFKASPSFLKADSDSAEEMIFSIDQNYGNKKAPAVREKCPELL